MAFQTLSWARRFLSQPNLTLLKPHFSTCALRFEKVDVDKIMHQKGEPEPFLEEATEIKFPHMEERQLQEADYVENQKNIRSLDGILDEHLHERIARIGKPPKSAMQSGTNNTHGWLVQFDTKQRWENPLMGWCSNGDPLSNMQLRFPTLESAIAFCEKNRFEYFVEKEKLVKPRVKSYAINFSWNKRTRTSTK